MNRPFRFLAVLLAGIAAVLPQSPARSAEPVKITLSYSATADFAPAFIAKETGIFLKHGLDVTLTNLATTSLGPPALQADSVQIASISPPLLLLANDGGMDLVGVAGVAAMDAKAPRSSLITRAGFTATTAQDFIGKKIARPGINSAIDLIIKKWLIDHGVRLDQVTLVETPFTQMGDLLRAGQIDAAFELEPLRTRIIESGAGQKSVDIFSATNPHIVASIYGSTREWASAHRDALRAFRAALEDAMEYRRDHLDETNAIQKKYIGASGTPDIMEPDLHPADFDFWIGVLHELKLIQGQPDATKLIMQ